MRPTLFAALLVLFAAQAVAAPRVLVSTKPIHSIVAAVMDGAGTPDLLLTGAASPHSYALKPSDARKIAQAELIFWTGPLVETFLKTPLGTLAPRARIVPLMEAQGVKTLAARKGGVWEADADEEASNAVDGHVWLDPDNTIAMAKAVAVALSGLDPGQASLYSANAQNFSERIAQMDRDLTARLSPLRGRPYLLFHDAYHYFENHYGLTPVGAIVVASDRLPGTRRVENIRARIKASGPICVFSTPQFSSRLVTALVDGTRARAGILDDMGAAIAPGPGLYETLMTRIAGSLETCMTP